MTSCKTHFKDSNIGRFTEELDTRIRIEGIVFLGHVNLLYLSCNSIGSMGLVIHSSSKYSDFRRDKIILVINDAVRSR